MFDANITQLIIQRTVYDLYFDFDSDSMISMPFSIEFRGLNKNALPTDGRTDGRKDIYRCVDASKKHKNFRHDTAKDLFVLCVNKKETLPK